MLEKSIEIRDVNVANTVNSRRVKTKTNSKHLIRYLKWVDVLRYFKLKIKTIINVFLFRQWEAIGKI